MQDNDTIFISSDDNTDNIFIAGYEKQVNNENKNKLIIVYLESLKHPFAYRNEDFPIVKSILEDSEYDLSFISNFKPETIIDCGGHIGTASVYFANKYPDAKIYTVEPEINNFKILTYNTIFYDNITRFRSAIWNKKTKVKVCDNGFGLAGHMIEEAANNITDSNIIESMTISEIMNLSKSQSIDILKIDIEGSEKELFISNTVDNWLSKVKVLMIELHDRMKEGCFDTFIKAVSKYNWYFAFSKENLVLVKR